MRKEAALPKLTELHCSVTPKLYFSKTQAQDGDDRSWIPGGYLIILMTEKLPGVGMDPFYISQEPDKKAQIQTQLPISLN